MHTPLVSALGGRDRQSSVDKASLVSMERSRTARATQQESVSNQQQLKSESTSLAMVAHTFKLSTQETQGARDTETLQTDRQTDTIKSIIDFIHLFT